MIGILPTALIENHDSRSSSSRAHRKREKVTRPAATRPLGSKDNTKGRSHSQQNDDFGVPRTRLPHATRPPETDSRTLAFSAVLRARKENRDKREKRCLQALRASIVKIFLDHCQGIGWVMGYLLISRYVIFYEISRYDKRH